MISETVTRRYVKALFEAAQATGQVAALAPYLTGLQDLWLSRDDLRATMLSPRLPVDKKRSVLMRLIGDGAPTLMQRFLGLLLDKRRIEVLAASGTIYDELQDEAAGVRHAHVVSAVPLSADQQQRLTETLSESLQAQIVVSSAVDPAVIGGLRVRVGDVLIDGTIRNRLEGLRKQLAG
ncbi:MAG: ATP synthase F1 subunit delta [Armatimonadia bacterium]